jgi:hypothetical protein
MPKPNLEYQDNELFGMEFDNTLLFSLPENNHRPVLNPFTTRNYFSEVILRSYFENNISILEKATNYPKDYYCNDWVFNKISIPEFTTQELKNNKNNHTLEDFLKNVSSPSIGDVAVYLSINKKEGMLTKVFKHFGLVSNIGKDIKIDSKWSGGNVYRHNLEIIPANYGNIVSFYRKK